MTHTKGEGMGGIDGLPERRMDLGGDAQERATEAATPVVRIGEWFLGALGPAIGFMVLAIAYGGVLLVWREVLSL